MTNPTSNYGFVLPTSTDLVTDLPADFEVALQGVDTRLKALQPGTTLGDITYSSATANTNTRLPIGTTGQVLAVSGGVPAWTTTADVTPLTTKGDLFTFTTADARLGVGTDGQTLVADSTASTGLKWATPSSGTPAFVGVGVTKSAAQSISNATFTAITFNGEAFDTDGFHDNVTNNTRITIPAGKAGYYAIAGTMEFDGNATGNRGCELRKNGTGVNYMFFEPTAFSPNSPAYPMSYILNLAVGDYLELFAYQTSGGALNVATGSTDWQMQFLGA